MPTKFKEKNLQIFYDSCRRLGCDLSSEFYVAGIPRRGAAHRNAYWNGRTGIKAGAYPKNSYAYSAWAAGRDDLRERGPVEGSAPRGFPTSIAA